MTSNTIPRREQDGEIVVDAIIEASALQEFVETLRAVADEAKIHFDDEGLHARIIDPANIAMERPDLKTDAFETYDSGAVTIGVSLVRLQDQIDMANTGDLIRLRVDMETRKLKLRVTENIKPTIALIDPDTIRPEPDYPDLDLPNEAVVHPDAIHDAIDAIDLVTDHIKIAWDAGDENLVFYGEGDVDDTRVEYGEEDLLGGSHFDSEAASLYSLGYFDEVFGVIPNDVEDVTVEFGTDYPILIHYVAQDGALTVDALIAPRIQSE